ncbi:MAG: prolipoprotein diacylglyceryl transferase [Clostridia bacterium]|nr:prolipoprotein diacylglyceryl transferase [Clostridia bacterium]
MLPYLRLGNRLIPMYGVCMTVGILLSSCLAFVRAKRAGKDENALIVIVACAVGIGLICARLLYVVVSYGVQQAILKILSGDFSPLTEGGLVFYGSLIGGILGGILGARIARESLSSYLAPIVPCIPLGHAFGRLGCFFGGCCYGMPYDGPLAVRFPAAGVTEPVFPVQLLEALINLVIFILLILYTRKSRPRGYSLYLYLLLYSVSRFTLEFLRGDKIRGLSNGLSTSQWISIVLFGGALLLMQLPIKKEAAHRHSNT